MNCTENMRDVYEAYQSNPRIINSIAFSRFDKKDLDYFIGYTCSSKDEALDKIESLRQHVEKCLSIKDFDFIVIEQYQQEKIVQVVPYESSTEYKLIDEGHTSGSVFIRKLSSSIIRVLPFKEAIEILSTSK